MCMLPNALMDINLPIACAVLALDSWNYCSGEQGPTAQRSARLYNLHYNAEQCI